MTNYETLMLARTEITDDEISSLERQLDKIVSSFKGKMTLFDKWGKYKLAYPVKKNIYGIYILSRYQVPPEVAFDFFKEVDSLFKIKYNELVMRNVTVRLEENVSSVYKYPEPVGAHRTSNLDSFIKENKMEGLIDTPVEKKEEKPKVEEKGAQPPVEAQPPVAEESEKVEASPLAEEEKAEEKVEEVKAEESEVKEEATEEEGK